VPLGTVLRKRSFERHTAWDGVFGRPRGEQVCLWRALSRPRCPSLRTGRPAARTAASAPLVKEGGAPRSSAPFHRRWAPSTPACAGALVPLAGFLQSIRFTSATAWTSSSPLPERVRLPSPARDTAAALLRAPPAGASRSRGPGAALAASASSRQCPEELPRNRSLPSTSLHGPVPPPAGEADRARRRRRWNEPTRGPRLRGPRAATLRAACAGAPARGFRPVRIT
jgi:hypothetical protein